MLIQVSISSNTSVVIDTEHSPLSQLSQKIKNHPTMIQSLGMAVVNALLQRSYSSTPCCVLAPFDVDDADVPYASTSEILD
jgi:hypothetical protein